MTGIKRVLTIPTVEDKITRSSFLHVFCSVFPNYICIFDSTHFMAHFQFFVLMINFLFRKKDSTPIYWLHIVFNKPFYYFRLGRKQLESVVVKRRGDSPIYGHSRHRSPGWRSRSRSRSRSPRSRYLAYRSSRSPSPIRSRSRSGSPSLKSESLYLTLNCTSDYCSSFIAVLDSIRPWSLGLNILLGSKSLFAIGWNLDLIYYEKSSLTQIERSTKHLTHVCTENSRMPTRPINSGLTCSPHKKFM